MKFIDTFAQISACFPAGKFDLEAWKRYAAGISADLLNLCLEDAATFDFDTLGMPVLAQYAASFAKAHTAHEAYLRCISGLEEQLDQLGYAVDAAVYLYLGLCNGAGWTTEVDGTPAVLLGLEKIVELDWCDDKAMTALIHHELGHLWHFQTRTAPAFANASLWQLYTEGVAMYFEQQLAGDPDYFHQDQHGWLPWCRAHQADMQKDYARRVQENASVQDFFGDWARWQGQPDTGYYLGNVLIQQLAQGRSITELANLTETAFASALTSKPSYAIL